MIPKNTYKILDFLAGNPTNKYNINQMARELKISVGSAYKILKNLEQKEIAIKEMTGNSILYKLNFKNQEAKKLCELILIEKKRELYAKNPIAKIYGKEIEKFDANATVLFGSILAKKEKANDVDVLFIANKTQVKKVNDFCLSIEKIKAKPVVPLIMTEKDFKDKLKEKNKVVLNIINSGIVLKGEGKVIEYIGDVY